ncbi:MAG TPA: VOC family protein [Acidimicrobiia bacterium]|nr:VOC family protein [Acidimicrobiia bacterium]
MTLQVDTVFIWVNDLEAAVEWYQTIGFEPGPLFETWQVMNVEGETKFALHQGIREPGPSTAVVSFRVGDLDSEITRLATQGIEPRDEITDTGTTRFTTFVDPDGNEIRLLER